MEWDSKRLHWQEWIHIGKHIWNVINVMYNATSIIRALSSGHWEMNVAMDRTLKHVING